jgi:hypothetical protein
MVEHFGDTEWRVGNEDRGEQLEIKECFIIN